MEGIPGTAVTQKLFLCLFFFFIACKIYILKHFKFFFPSVHLKLSLKCANNRGIYHAGTRFISLFYATKVSHKFCVKYIENDVNDVSKKILCIPAHLKDSNPCWCKQAFSNFVSFMLFDIYSPCPQQGKGR